MTAMDALVRDWVDYLRVEKGASTHTVSNYLRDALTIRARHGKPGRATLTDVSAHDVEEHLAGLASGQVSGRPAALSSVARACAAIRGLHRYALAEGSSTSM